MESLRPIYEIGVKIGPAVFFAAAAFVGLAALLSFFQSRKSTRE